MRRLTVRRLDPDFAPTWSPDGSKIAFMSDHDDAGWDIYVTGSRHRRRQRTSPTCRRLRTVAGLVAGRGPDRLREPARRPLREIYVVDVAPPFNVTRITNAGAAEPPRGHRTAGESLRRTVAGQNEIFAGISRPASRRTSRTTGKRHSGLPGRRTAEDAFFSRRDGNAESTSWTPGRRQPRRGSPSNAAIDTVRTGNRFPRLLRKARPASCSPRRPSASPARRPRRRPEACTDDGPADRSATAATAPSTSTPAGPTRRDRAARGSSSTGGGSVMRLRRQRLPRRLALC